MQKSLSAELCWNFAETVMSKLCEASHNFDYEKKNVMRSKSSDKRRIHTEYRKHFA